MFWNTLEFRKDDDAFCCGESVFSSNAKAWHERPLAIVWKRSRGDISKRPVLKNLTTYAHRKESLP